MRPRVIACAVLATALGMAAPSLGSPTVLAATTPVHAPTTTPATEHIVVRPVTDSGAAASGYHVVSEDLTSGTVNCSYRQPSAGAVSRNIERCDPSAAYAIACWRSATVNQVLCMRNPSSHRVYSIGRVGRFANTSPVRHRVLAPLLLILADGTRCSIRDGGAWNSLKAHPHWYGAYSCDHHGNVWSPMSAPHSGVNESQATWTVHTSAASGNGRVTIRTVSKAYFVGTKH